MKVINVFNPDHLWIDMLARAFNGEELTGDQQVTNPYTGVSEAYFNASSARESPDRKFNNLITGTICVAGILVGVQTYRSLESNAPSCSSTRSSSDLCQRVW